MKRLTPIFAFVLPLSACGDKDPTDTGGGTEGGTGGGEDTAVDSGEPWPVDADGDGFSAEEDCDAADPAVFPGADEACNGIDDDCDDEIDEDAVDMATFYADGDGDGFGAGEVQACALGDGLSEVAGDCDDADAAVHPDAAEVGCNGVDDDCDGDVDADLVPTDFPDIASAVAALSDGAEVCVEPGTYVELLDLSGRSLQTTGQAGSAATVLDLGTTAPMLTLVGESETADAGDVGLTGFTVSGGDFTADGAALQGGFARVVGSTLRLRDIVFDGGSVTMENGGTLQGGLLYGSGAALSLEDVTVSGLSLSFAGERLASNENLEGGFLGAWGSEVSLTSVQVSDLSARGDAGRVDCRLFGAAVHVDEGSTLDAADLGVDGADIELDCADQTNAAGAVLNIYDSGSTITGLSVTGSRVRLVSATRAYLSALVRADDFQGEGRQVWTAVDISDNDLSTDAASVSVVYGAAFVEDDSLSHVTVWTNTIAATGAGGRRAGSASTAAVELRGGDMDHLDVRGLSVTGDSYASELVWIEAYEGTSSLHNFIIAGNSVTAPRLYGMALGASAELGTTTLEHGDVVGNTFTGAPYYGVVTVGGEEESDRVVLRHVQVTGNTVVSDEASIGLAEWNETGESASVSYCNVWGHDAQTNWGDPPSADGNLSADPQYTDVSSADPTAWDLTLSAGSPAIDAGDPTTADVDGTTSDLGAFGGAAAAW